VGTQDRDAAASSQVSESCPIGSGGREVICESKVRKIKGCSSADFREVKMEILQFGPDVKVLEPEELIENARRSRRCKGCMAQEHRA